MFEKRGGGGGRRRIPVSGYTPVQPYRFQVGTPFIGQSITDGATDDALWGVMIIIALIAIAGLIVGIISLVRDPNSGAFLSECLTQIFFGNGTVLANSCGFTTAGPSSFNDNLDIFGEFSVHNTSSFGGNTSVNGNLTVQGGFGSILLDSPSALAVCDQCPVPSDEIVLGICNNTACEIEFEQIQFTNDSIQEFCQACNISVELNITGEIADEICNSTDCVIVSDRIIFLQSTIDNICDVCNSEIPDDNVIFEICDSQFCFINSTRVVFEQSTVDDICSQCDFAPDNTTIANICDNDNCQLLSSQVTFLSSTIFDICNSTSCFVDSTRIVFQPETINLICNACEFPPPVIDNATKEEICEFCLDGIVQITGSLDISQTLNVQGFGTFAQNVEVGGNLLVNGNVTFIGSTFTITPDITVLGDINMPSGNIIAPFADGNFSRINTFGTIQSGSDVNILPGGNLNIGSGSISMIGNIFQVGTLNTGFIDSSAGVNSTFGNFAGVLTTEDDLFVGDDLEVFDSFTVLFGESNVERLFVNERLEVADNGTFLSHVNIAGDLFVGGTIEFGSISFDDLVAQNLTIQQLTTLDGDLTVGAISTFNANVSMTENLQVNGILSVGGDVSLNSTLAVVNDMEVCGNSSMKGNLAVDQGLFVEGFTTLNSSLLVNGSAVFDTQVSVVGDLEVCGTETVKGNLSVEQTLLVGNNTNIEQDLEVCGNTFFKGNVTANQTLLTDNISANVAPWVTVDGTLQAGFSLQVPFDPTFLPTNSTVKFGLSAGPATTVMFDVTTVCVTSSACVPSDSRLKKNINTVNRTKSLETINNLSVKEFEYIDQYEKFANIPHGRKEIGFIAQEVEKYIPEAVGHKKDFTLNDGGFHIEDMRTLDKEQIFSHLVAAVQKLSSIIKTQQYELKILQNKIKSIQSSSSNQ